MVSGRSVNLSVCRFIGTGSPLLRSKMTVDLEKVKDNEVKKVPSLDRVKLGSLWADDTVVITFFRRFG